MNDRESAKHDAIDATEAMANDGVEALINDRLDTEAVAQMVEHIDFTTKLSQKLSNAFRAARADSSRNAGQLEQLQGEVRQLLMDVELVKRALVSLGHVGVMERRKIEKELVRELLPPTRNRRGLGVIVNSNVKNPPKRVDCENRLHLCKAACCRIFNAGLTPQEIESDKYEWDVRQPYALQRNNLGCVHLKAGSCACGIYTNRPQVCQGYSCQNDKRIWDDFDRMILNRNLQERLKTLDVDTTASTNAAAAPRVPTSDAQSPSQPQRQSSPADVAAGRQAQPRKEEPNGKNRDQPKVAAPNFDELREFMVPLPAKRFAPPPDDHLRGNNLKLSDQESNEKD